MYKAIDIHAHFGNPDSFPQCGLEKEFFRVSLEMLKREYDKQNVSIACISPMEGIFPISEWALLDANNYMEELAESHDWIYQWVIVDPLVPSSYKQAERILKNRKCVGVKIHPDAHGYSIEDYADEIFAFCHEHGAILESHSGEKMSLPEKMVTFADKYSNMTLIVSHLGCGYDGCIEHQVNAIKASKNGNIYTDVSSAKSILFYIVEWAVNQVTAEKILFGTDTPLHHIPMMKRRVETADISEQEKDAIFYQNAYKLLQGVLNR